MKKAGRLWRATTSLLLIFVLLASGCGGGGGSSKTTDSTAPQIQGVLQLPAGVSDGSTLSVATGNGSATVSKNGSFSVPASAGTSLASVTDASGKLVLLGFIASDGEARIGTRQTAIALLFMALGAYTLPASQQDAVRTMLNQSAAAEALAGVIETRLASNLTALADGDAEILAAINAAHASLTAVVAPSSASVRALSVPRAIPLVNEVPGTTLSLINPTNPQQGLQFGPNPDGDGVILMNTYRRASYYYIYKTGTEDQDGNRHDITPPLPVLSAAHMKATNALNGTLGSVIDVLNGSVFWTPVKSDPVVLPLDEGAAKTFYQAVAVGPSFDLSPPSFFSDPRYAGVQAEWNDKVMVSTLSAFVKDMFLPVLFTWVLDSRKINEVLELDPEFISKDIGELLLKTVPELQDQVTTGQWRDAMATVVKEIAAKDDLRNSLIETLRAKLAATNIKDALGDPEAVLSSLSKANAILAVIDKAMTAGDIGAVVKDIGSSRRGNVWDITVIQPKIRINPEEATAEAHDRIALTAQPPAGVTGTFIYRWKLTGSNGTLENSVGLTGNEFDTSTASITYVAGASVTDGAVDTVKLSLYVRPDNGSGPTHGEIFLGSAESKITGKVPERCTDVDYAPLKSGCGAVTLSSATLTAGDKLTVSVWISDGLVCGGAGATARLSADYATTSVVVDGVPMTASSGVAPMYSYWYGYAVDPQPRGGVVVTLPTGGHTVEFTLRHDAPNDCVFQESGSTRAAGPWVVLGTGGWSTVVPFKVQQKGI